MINAVQSNSRNSSFNNSHWVAILVDFGKPVKTNAIALISSPVDIHTSRLEMSWSLTFTSMVWLCFKNHQRYIDQQTLLLCCDNAASNVAMTKAAMLVAVPQWHRIEYNHGPWQQRRRHSADNCRTKGIYFRMLVMFFQVSAHEMCSTLECLIAFFFEDSVISWQTQEHPLPMVKSSSIFTCREEAGNAAFRLLMKPLSSWRWCSCFHQM